MHYVILASHSAEICPLANSKTHEFMMKVAPEIPNIAKKLGVRIVAGPFVSREHLSVIVVETEKYQALDQFIMESGLEKWNSVKVLPSLTLEEGMREMTGTKTIF